ncbi:MAG: DUF1344 domain-containing protein [Candidatus Rokubacteria bacterium]|nr:DUF1344 domain-containing protein [Candidatus Rokubacteria bacterium]
MKTLTGIAMALLLGLSAVTASAEQIQGTVKSVDAVERTFTLDNGTQVWVAEGVSMDALKEGASVKATYEERDDKKVVTTIEVE